VVVVVVAGLVAKAANTGPTVVLVEQTSILRRL
jgi:hypothetical protein